MEFVLEIICAQKIKDGLYIKNLDEYADVGTHWIALYNLNIEVIYSLTVLELTMFLKKLKNLLVIKT